MTGGKQNEKGYWYNLYAKYRTAMRTSYEKACSEDVPYMRTFLPLRILLQKTPPVYRIFVLRGRNQMQRLSIA